MISDKDVAQNRVEEALRKSEERFRFAMEAAREGIWDWDLKTDRVEYSPAYYRMLGYEAPEVEDVSFWISLLHPDDREKIVTLARKLLNSPGRYELEFRLRAKDGSYRWIVSRGKVVEWDESGAPLRAVGTHTDITDRMQAEAILRESESRFRQVADTAPVMIWMSGPDTLCTYFNKTWLEFTGRRIEQEIGNQWAEGVHEEDYQHCIKTYNTAFAVRRPFKMEYRLRRRDGVYRWLLDHGAPRFNERGDFLGFIGSCVDISDRKKAEEALRRSKEELRRQHEELEAIYRNAPIGLAAFDKNLRYRRINQRLAQIGGPPAEAHIDRTICEIVPAMAPIIEEAARAVLAGQTPIKNREIYGETLAHPGILRCFTDSWYPIFDDKGDISGCGVVVEDITEKKKVEEELKQTTERLNLAQSAAEIGIWDWNLSTNESFVNDEWRSIYGISGNTALSYEDFVARLHPADRDAFLNMEQQAFSGGGKIEGEMRIVRENDGHTRWVAHKGRVLFASNGEPVRAMGAVWDITTLKEAQEVLLQRSEERYRRIVETAQEGIWLLDAEAQTVFVNPKMAQLLGYTVDEMLGRDLLDFMDDEWKCVAKQKLINRAAGVVETHDFKFQRKEGSDLWAILSCAPIFEADAYQGALAMVMDFTDRKRLEEERQRYFDELKQSYQRKDEFLATLGHELRTPLATIKLAMDVIAGDKAIAEKFEALFSRMQRQVKHLTRMVEDILQVSRMNRGRIELQKEKVDLNRLLAQIEDSQRAKFEQKGIQLSISLTEQPLSISGDSVRLIPLLSDHDSARLPESASD